ncbi:MAG: NAD(P)-dependent oxidoreductase [Acetobacteraceae bacterium]|nr:NAD(P)-dependent oxidoreductase [Acetobacteraceae bacterium]
MPDRIAVVAPGAMGSGIARVLTSNGAEVPTLLAERSEASRTRAEQAGMRDATEAELVGAELILSIVPPAVAKQLAERLSEPLRGAARKPVFVDCNALDVRTVRAVGEVIAGAGAPFVDGGIIGGPPKPGAEGPTLYLSGDEADRVAQMLRRFGVKARAIAGGVGAASALKMSYAGINKGMTAIAAAMILGATRAGAAEALLAELRETQPQLVARFARGLPDMIPKAYRWVAEMREIAAFLDGDPAGAAMFEGAAELYERIAQAEGGEVTTLKEFARALAE